MIRIVVMCHAARPHLRPEGVGVLLGEESSMRLLYLGLNESGCDLNSRINGCPVEEHSLVEWRTLDFKKKKSINQSINT